MQRTPRARSLSVTSPVGRALIGKALDDEVVDTSTLPLDRVSFGTRVVLEDVDSGEEAVYTLVGESEANVKDGLLSVRSPGGRALIGKVVDDEVTVVVPAGTRTYEVRAIEAME